jgi:hypothetical protein
MARPHAALPLWTWVGLMLIVSALLVLLGRLLD